MHNKWFIAFVFFLLSFGLSCEQTKAGLDQLFPGPGFEKGWSWHGKPKHYSPQNLYVYINGEAELYLAYDFKELASLTYFWGSPEDTFITVDIYDMGTPLNAFGLYCSYRYPGYAYEKIGAEAFVSDFGLKFLKDRLVIEIKTSDESEKCRKAGRTIALQIASRIAGPDVFPDIVSMLPEKDQIPYTLKYTAKEMLNQSFLPGGLEAKYKLGNDESTGFVVLFSDQVSAEEGLKKLKAFYKESDAQFLPDMVQPGVLTGMKTRYHGYILMNIQGTVLNGIQDLSSPEKGFFWMSQMHSQLLKQ